MRANKLVKELSILGALSLVLLASVAGAQEIPQKFIPPTVQVEMRLLQAQFKTALHNDCAADKCFPKGCQYVNHLTLDQPRTTSLPGLPADEGLGSVDPQEYLTEARCAYSHEKKVRGRDVRSLNRRLEKRLSSGWLKVSVVSEALEPIPKSLADEAPVKEDKPKEVKKEEEKPVVETPPPEPWTSDKVFEEFWHSILPHFPWMIAIFLLTFATLILIWAGRKLGKPSMEDRMLEAQLAAGPPEPDEQIALTEPEDQGPSPKELAEQSFVEEQEAEWAERIDRMEVADEDNVVMQLLREWLKKGEYETLARALFVFGDKVSHAFAKDTEFAMKKVDFAEYFREVDEKQLPSRGEFYRKLNQQAMSSQLLSQDDVQLYRSLREEFGSSGVLNLMALMPSRYGALLFALIPREGQHDVAKMMPQELRVQVAEQLLSSTRISKEEGAYIFACVDAAKNEGTLPPPPRQTTLIDRGPSLDGASALSILLTHVSSEERNRVFARALNDKGGSVPRWYEDILFNHMLSNLSDDVRNDLLLDVDVRALGAWLSLQSPPWQKAFVTELSQSMQNALRASSGFSSRAEQMRLANRGHKELVAALKSNYARDNARFVDLVG